MTSPSGHLDERFSPVAHSATFNRILDTLGLRAKKILDMGCGYGEYLVCFGTGSVGVTTTPAQVEYGVEKGIAIIRGNVELIDELALAKDFQGLWANNLFEHLLAPHAFLIKLKTISAPDAVLVLGVPVVPKIASLMKVPKFRGALATAHINFFTRETLRLTVERAGWKVQTVRPFIFSNIYLDWLCSFVAPHLYVVAYNDPTFTYHIKKVIEWQDDAHYDKVLAIAGPRAH